MSSRGVSPLKRVMQAAGFLIGLGLLVWVARIALSPENREQLLHLRQASPALIGGLVGCSVALLLTGGTTFWAVLLPVRRLPYWDFQAANAIAVVLAYVPFKLSVVFRVLVHRRRDGLPLVTIGAWFGAFAAIILASLAAFLGALLITRGVNGAWVGLMLGLLLIACAMLTISARLFSGTAGLGRLHRAVDALHIGLLSRLARSGPAHRAHDALRMLTSPPRVGTLLALRLLDFAVQTLRFYLAAQALGTPVSLEAAVIFSTTQFLISIASPSGVLGTREAGTTGMAGLLDLIDMKQAAAISVLILATESIINLAAAAMGVAKLGPRTMFTPPDKRV